MSRTIGNAISPEAPLSCGHGPTLIIWCTAGVSGMEMPAMSPIFGLHTPQAITTCSASMSPPLVRTRVIRDEPSAVFSVSSPVTSTVGTTVRAPDSSAFSRMIVPARSESTTPTEGVQNAPMICSGSRNGTFSATNSGLTSSASIPQARAEDIRRRSSSMRSSVRATSNPPDSVKTPISLYCRMLSSVRSVISREWSTGKMKFDAWPVEPPGFGSAPLSIWTMSRQPCCARCCTRLLPTMPAPMTTTRAEGGTEAIKASFQRSEDAVAHSATLCAIRNALSSCVGGQPRVNTPAWQPPHAPLLRQRCQRVTSGSLFDTVVGVLSTGREGVRSGDALQPGVDLAGVRGDPLVSGGARTHVVLRDVLRDQVLVVVRPAPVLHQLQRWRPGLLELGGDQLVQVVGRVVAGHRRGVQVAARGVLRKVHRHHRNLLVEPLRRVPVPDHPLVLLLGRPVHLDQGRLAARDHHLVVQV